jgi:hypothetical protein
MKPRSVVFWLALLTAAQAWSADKASEKIYRLQWRDLDGMIRGRRIALTLPSGARLQGDVISVQSGELLLDVRKTSNRHTYPKGRTVVPRPEITSLRLWSKKSGYRWRALGTAIGAGVGAAIACPVAAYTRNEGADAGGIIALIVAVPTGLGYLAGWSADRGESVEILVVADGKPTQAGPEGAPPVPLTPPAAR